MQVNVILLCYNESVLLPHTISHYKKYLPNCLITVYDNQSRDNSVAIATSLGCKVIEFDSGNILNEWVQKDIRNSCWKSIDNGWIIMADMDEWICVTEQELNEEMQNDTTVLKIYGVEMIGESSTLDLSDIDLHSITKHVYFQSECKNLCFLREKIIDMNFDMGSHNCNPSGIVKYSSKFYTNKHMSKLGLPFIVNKVINRYNRTHLIREYGYGHYTNDIQAIENEYNSDLERSMNLS